MNEEQKRLIEQIRDMAINDLKNQLSDDEIDEIVSSATDTLNDANEFPMPSSMYFGTVDSDDNQMNGLLTNVNNIVEKYFDVSLSDREIFVKILESGDIGPMQQQALEYIETAIKIQRKYIQSIGNLNE